ncbi:PD-(D/E)XK nuclease family protein [Thermogladius sp. 4427co]|uniref:PD-(D/E)XK nuclease family protein n=1 Tax=Thermogladius sp. 4427co TaxID=3450718 RepID=UPI003F7B23E5
MATAKNIKEELLALLERDSEFRYAVAGLLGLNSILDELKKLREDFLLFVKNQERRWEENNRRWEDAYKRFDAIELELKKLREDFNKLYESVMKRMDSFERRLAALGARWGVESEEAFREGLKAIIEKELGLRVERWQGFDSRGVVYGYPSVVEVDVAISDEKIILVEIKSHASASDVSVFRRKSDFYEESTGRKVSRRILVTPFADSKAFEAASKLGVEIYTGI